MACVYKVKYKTNKSIFAFIYENGLVCLGPTRYSSAGEYRILVTNKKFLVDKRDHPIVSTVLGEMQTHQGIEFIANRNDDALDPLLLFSITWIWYNVSIMDKEVKLDAAGAMIRNSLSSTINTTNVFQPFHAIFTSNKRLFNKIIKQFGLMEVNMLTNAIFPELRSQKLIPVPTMALDRDLHFALWKELHVGELRIPGVVHWLDWFWLEPSSKFIYDTPYMREKYNKSREIADILANDLERIREKLAVVDEKMAEIVRIPYYYAKENILLSDKSIVIIYPHAGVSMDNLDEVIKFDTVPVSKALATLNGRGIIHNDLHLGNIVHEHDKTLIIDFSDCVIYPQDVRLIVNNYYEHFPTLYSENEHQIKSMAEINPARLFNIWTAYDWFKLSKDIINVGKEHFDSETIEAVTKINESAWRYLSENIGPGPDVISFNDYLLGSGAPAPNIPSLVKV